MNNGINMETVAGLSEEEVQIRVLKGLTNDTGEIKTKSIPRIMRENVCTRFNAMNLALAIIVFWTGSYQNMLFMVVVLCNTCIGMVQEIRAKLAIDKLCLLWDKGVTVIRGGTKQQVPIEQVVQDDVLELKAGSQVCADCTVLKGRCEANEGLVTGEADLIEKREGDVLLSGSFLASGACLARAQQVGKNSYAARISAEAKYYKKPVSQMMRAIGKIIKTISIIIVPIGAVLFYNQYIVQKQPINGALLRTVAALVGMIPEGLVLLTSMAFALSVIRLTKRRALVQELYCIEQLARIDVLCLDKTGTITQGDMEVVDTGLLTDISQKETADILCALARAIGPENPTMEAITQKYADESDWQVQAVTPFSSERKWGSVQFWDRGIYVLGAPEFVWKKGDPAGQESMQQAAEEGRRVLLLAKAKSITKDKELEGVTAIAFLVLQDKIRENARQTLEYFARQGVDIKIISGDNPKTVSAVGKQAGVFNADKWVDTSTLTDEELAACADEYAVFGRVLPQQKRTLVRALKNLGRSVAMTGDGVNDVLALKEADCSIAMASGSEAARNVANMVLLDSDFSVMPHIVAEGRRCINNIGRTASLFLMKTVFAVILGILFVFLRSPYIFVPIQLTLISAVAIGIPAFFLTFEPNFDRVDNDFLYHVVRKALPSGLTVVCNILLIEAFAWFLKMPLEEVSTIAVFTTVATGFLLLRRVCEPMTKMRRVLFVVLWVLFLTAAFGFAWVFSLVPLRLEGLIVLAFLLVFSWAAYEGLVRIVENLHHVRARKNAK